MTFSRSACRGRPGFEVITAASVDESVKIAEANDVAIILNSVAGDTDSDETRQVLQRATQVLVKTPIVVLSDGEQPHQVRNALLAGARGYVPTSMSLDDTIGALWFVQAGGQFLPATCIVGLGRSDAESVAGSLRPRVTEIFTARQAEVVKELCQGKPNKIIAYDLTMKESTVKVHVRKCYSRREDRFLRYLAWPCGSLDAHWWSVRPAKIKGCGISCSRQTEPSSPR